MSPAGVYAAPAAAAGLLAAFLARLARLYAAAVSSWGSQEVREWCRVCGTRKRRCVRAEYKRACRRDLAKIRHSRVRSHRSCLGRQSKVNGTWRDRYCCGGSVPQHLRIPLSYPGSRRGRSSIPAQPSPVRASAWARRGGPAARCGTGGVRRPCRWWWCVCGRVARAPTLTLKPRYSGAAHSLQPR